MVITPLLGSVSAGWIGIGILVIFAAAILGFVMLTLARTDRVLDSMYRNNSRFRERVHMAPADHRVFYLGLRAGFVFAAVVCVAGVAAGVVIIVAKGF